MFSIERYHDISAGHRVLGHEGKCRNLHGHNYRIHFTVVPSWDVSELDNVGRVIDFSVVKSTLCQWLEDNWDHKMILWQHDPMVDVLKNASGIVVVPFNPTAENMAYFLVSTIGPQVLAGTGVMLHAVRVEETRKCSATYVRSLP